MTDETLRVVPVTRHEYGKNLLLNLADQLVPGAEVMVIVLNADGSSRVETTEMNRSQAGRTLLEAQYHVFQQLYDFEHGG